MGIYDRNYLRDDKRRDWLSDRPMVVNLILLTGIVFVAQLIFGPRFTDAIGLHANLFSKPWQAYQLMTYGFAHSEELAHIVFNMFGLWMFGTDLEGVYGRFEFLRIYLLAIVLSGLAWVAFTLANSNDPGNTGPLIGASGAVMAVLTLFVFRYPQRKILLMGFLPLPAWAVGALYVFGDLSMVQSRDTVAHIAHLAGALFGAVYYLTGMNLGRFVPRRLSTAMFRLRPRLRIHEPEAEERDLGREVDEILAKIHREGEASLTKSERRKLEEASRRYQRRRQ